MPRLDGPLGVFLDEHLTGPLNQSRARRTTEATTQLENNTSLDTDVRNVRPGDGSVSLSTGEFSVKTTATGTDTQALETGFEATPFVRDRPLVLMVEPFGGNDLSSEEAVINIREAV